MRPRAHPKPAHLSAAYASQFQDAAVARSYRHRPPYPRELFPALAELIGHRVRKVLDLGTGAGAVARGLVDLVDRVDAVDISRPLLDIARSLPNGNHANIRWIQGSAEEAPLDPPYSLVTAGSSLHWMDWEIVLPRVRAALQPGGYLAIFDETIKPLPWDGPLRQLISQFSTNREYRPYDLIEELQSRALFKLQGVIPIAAIPFKQSIDDYIESMHSRNGFSRDRMPPEIASDFDRQFREMLEPHCVDGLVRMEVYTEVIYGISAP